MTIDSTSLYSAQALANYYRQQSTRSTSGEEGASSFSTSEVSLVNYLTQLDNTSFSVADIQTAMQFDTKGQMNKFKMAQNDEMEAFKASSDAIIDLTDEDLTTDDMLALLTNLQESMGDFTPTVSGLNSDTDLATLTEDEVSDLFEEVKSSTETLRANAPEGNRPMGPPPGGIGMDSEEEEDNIELSIEDWFAKLQETFSSDETYSDSDIDAALFSLLDAV